jgi:EXLDI family protein
MPIKTIYVSDSDVQVFDAAKQKSGGNLSATIINTLKDYVAASDVIQSGYDQIQVKIGTAVTRIVHFMGMKLLGAYDAHSRQVYVIYATRGEKYAVVTCELPERPSTESSDAWTAKMLGWLNHSFDDLAGNYRLHIYATIDELEKFVPESIAALLHDRLGQIEHPIEFLDI